MADTRHPEPRRATAAVVAAVLAAVFGCTEPTGTPGPVAGADSAPGPLRVAAASDLQTALPALIEGFRRDHPGAEVSTVFGPSGQLAEQIHGGAPYDLFLAANEAYVDRLARVGDVTPASVRPYAVGALVLVVAGDVKEPVAGIEDLTRPGVKKVAIANPEVAPYGAAAREALQRAGLWDRLADKLVIAESVRQALQYVQTGNAEAGLVGRAVGTGASLRTAEIDPKLYHPIVQALGVVSRTQRAGDAEAFARFVAGQEGQAILAAHGFRSPPAAGRGAGGVGG